MSTLTNQDVCNAAIFLSGETIPAGNTDYTARAPALLALIYNECLPLDTAYRVANHLQNGTWTPAVTVGLAQSFPLCDVFSSPVSYALAALLTIDENQELSNVMQNRFSSLMDEIRRTIPASHEPIKDVYHLF